MFLYERCIASLLQYLGLIHQSARGLLDARRVDVGDRRNENIILIEKVHPTPLRNPLLTRTILFGHSGGPLPESIIEKYSIGHVVFVLPHFIGWPW
jgi:hypothetical protein